MNRRSLRAFLKTISLAVALSSSVAASVAAESEGFGERGALPEKGVCAFTGTMSYPFTYMYGPNPGPGWGVTMLGSIDWQARTMAVNIVQINPAGSASTEVQVQAKGTFALSAGPIPRTALLTASLNIGNSPAVMGFNVMPVGNGSSVLIQSAAGPVGSADGGFVAECKF